MAAAVYNIYLDQGSSYALTLIFKDSDRNPINQTGKTFAGQIREAYNSITAVATFTIALANQITDPGKVFVSLSAADTAAIPVDPPGDCNKNQRPTTQYQYDIEMTNVDSTVERIIQGVVFVSPEVTK